MNTHDSNGIACISTISQQLKLNEIRTKICEDIQQMQEKYNIENNVFGWSNNKTVEITYGYYEELQEFDNLGELIENFDPKTNLIRIKNDKYFLGTWSNTLGITNENHIIIDLDAKKII